MSSPSLPSEGAQNILLTCFEDATRFPVQQLVASLSDLYTVLEGKAGFIRLGGTAICSAFYDSGL